MQIYSPHRGKRKVYVVDVYYVSVLNSVERDSPLTKFPLTDSTKVQLIEKISPSTSLGDKTALRDGTYSSIFR
jgi:hypothetical protein